MGNRIDLHLELKDDLGNNNVYYNPPEDLKMSYPCIRYELETINSINADNLPYKNSKLYKITLIHPDPDNVILEKILNHQYTKVSTIYQSNNLYHYVLERYY